MTTDAEKNNPTYTIDAENAAEMARLLRQARLITKNMGGLFPESIDRPSIHRVLDIACGPGGWPLAVAATYPEMHVTGIDISTIMIEYARAQAQEQDLSNVTFQVQDARKPLDFPDNSFDLVNGRFLFGFMSPSTWPQLLQECARITRPGGVLLMTETECPLSNSLATQRIYTMGTEALKRAGQSLSPDGLHVGITPMLGKFFRDAHYRNIQHQAHVIDCSMGTEAYQEVYQDFAAAYKLLQPFLIKTGVTTQEEVEGVYQRMLEEQQLPDFCQIWFYLSVWGEKPLKQEG